MRRCTFIIQDTAKKIQKYINLPIWKIIQASYDICHTIYHNIHERTSITICQINYVFRALGSLNILEIYSPIVKLNQE